MDCSHQDAEERFVSKGQPQLEATSPECQGDSVGDSEAAGLPPKSIATRQPVIAKCHPAASSDSVGGAEGESTKALSLNSSVWHADLDSQDLQSPLTMDSDPSVDSAAKDSNQRSRNTRRRKNKKAAKGPSSVHSGQNVLQLMDEAFRGGSDRGSTK